MVWRLPIGQPPVLERVSPYLHAMNVVLNVLPSGAIHYDPYGRQFLSFGYNQKIEDVQRMVRSGKCVLLESDPLDAAVVNALRASDGINLTTLMTSANPFRPTVPTTVYRLHPAGELNR